MPQLRPPLGACVTKMGGRPSQQGLSGAPVEKGCHGVQQSLDVCFGRTRAAVRDFEQEVQERLGKGSFITKVLCSMLQVKDDLQLFAESYPRIPGSSFELLKLP